MPSSISFLPAPAPAAAPSTPSSEQPSGDSAGSFDSVLNQAAPAPGKAGQRMPATGAERSVSGSDNVEKSAKDATTSDADASTTGEKPSLLSAEELAALLALMGAPVAMQTPPPPVILSGDALCEPSSSDVLAEGEANFATLPSTAGTSDDAGVSRTPTAAKAETNAVFTLDTGADDAGAEANVRDLIKQGAEVIDYQLQTSPVETTPALPADTLASTPEQAPAAGIDTSTMAAAAPEVVDSAVKSGLFAQQTSSSATQPVDGTSPRRMSAEKITAKTASEKIAATATSREFQAASGVKSSIEPNKNNFLNVDGKQVNEDITPVGTSAANWGDSMNSESRSTPFVARLIDGALSLLGTSQAGTTATERSADTAATNPVSSAQAVQIVNEIRDIADGLWAVERNSVEVRFHFSEHERLTVKVEYRDGVVQTTFRTNSNDLRDTIAREWQVQVASASDARPYRVADPVFNTPPADARGFSLGGDASRQQRQAEQSNNAQHTFATASGRGPSSSSVAAAPATTFTRPDTALHLHAFA